MKGNAIHIAYFILQMAAGHDSVRYLLNKIHDEYSSFFYKIRMMKIWRTQTDNEIDLYLRTISHKIKLYTAGPEGVHQQV